MTALENKSQPITQETASTKNDNTPTATPQQRFQINSVEVKNFKRISEAKVPLNVITYLVGGNNSGKSSVLQAIHTAVSCMQISVEQGQKVVPESDLRYSPTAHFEQLGHERPYENNKGRSRGTVTFEAISGDDPIIFSIEMYKARNHNNAGVEYTKNSPLRPQIADPSRLFSVYVPGLTGIPHREEYKSFGSILRMAAGGEANLVFRNIVYHLKERDQIARLEDITSAILSSKVEFQVKFNDAHDQFIEVSLSLNGGAALPVDLWGTGVLQVTQIAAYALLFEPTVLLIDEPDSHLHPSWQKTMAATFDEIAQSLGCRIVITTHSRHMITAAPEGTRVVWMKDGRVADSDARELSEVLLDLEALDSFDRDAKIIVYTEDEKDSSLKQCLDGIPISRDISLLPYNGLKNAPKVKQINSLMHILNKDATIIIHRDRDCMTNEELTTWAEPYENAGMVTFVPRMSDTESYYCTPEYLAAALKVSEQEARAIIDKCIQDNMQDLREKFDSKRAEANSLYHSRDGRSPISDDLWNEWNQDGSMRHIYGKRLLELIKQYTKNYSTKQRLGKVSSSDLAQEFQVLLNSISKDLR
jgi:putative uncharacterized protein h16_B2391